MKIPNQTSVDEENIGQLVGTKEEEENHEELVGTIEEEGSISEGQDGSVYG